MKNILIFSDGTSENSKGGGDKLLSNIGKLYKASIKNQHQLVKYDEGIGSSGTFIGQALAQATGYGLRQNVLELYRFLCENYNAGDEIYLFGFSRGAFTVRSLSGMISAFGLVVPNERNFSIVNELYKFPKEERMKQPSWKDFQAIPTVKVRVKFLAALDTVGAIGIPVITPISKKMNNVIAGFHDTNLRNVDFAYHLLSMDEYRTAFKPILWTSCNDEDVKELQQIWFIGSHTDIGGGYLSCELSNIVLEWLYRKAIACGAKFEPIEADGSYCGKVNDAFNSMPLYKFMGKYFRKPGEHKNIISGYPNTPTEFAHITIQARLAKTNEKVLNIEGYRAANDLSNVV